MAVVDRDELTIEITRLPERVEHLCLVDDVARLGRGMHVATAQHAAHHVFVTKQEPAALLGRGLARVRDDLIAQFAWKDKARPVDQRPPAIAGMTMTSLPSGTTAPLPPRARASSSPM